MIPPKRPKMMQVISVKQNSSSHISNFRAAVEQFKHLIKRGQSVNEAEIWMIRNWTKSGYLDKSDVREIANEAMKREKRNPSRMAKSAVALRRKIRTYPGGLPEDQTTAAERKIVREYPQYFENDRGYIKVKVTGKRRARNPKEQRFWVFLLLTKAGYKQGKGLEIWALNEREAKRQAKTQMKSLGYKVEVIRVDKNPYASEAQRRKFHAMAERGEISQAVVNEYDKESKGLDLPERVSNPQSYIAQVWALPGKLLIGGVKTIKSSRFQSKQDAQNWVWALLENYNNNIGKQTIIKSNKAPEIRRNATADDFKSYQKVKLQDLVRKFQGHSNGLKHRVLQSDLTPKNKYLLGCLALMKVKANGKIIPIEFSGAAYLAADLRNNLHAVGKDAIIENVKKPNPGQLKELGKLIQIDYITAKSHIENGETVRFWHKLAEVDGQYPTLYIDHDGFPIINGGGYDIWSVGIVN